MPTRPSGRMSSLSAIAHMLSRFMSSPAALEPLRKKTQIAAPGARPATAAGICASSSARVLTNRKTSCASAGSTKLTTVRQSERLDDAGNPVQDGDRGARLDARLLGNGLLGHRLPACCSRGCAKYFGDVPAPCVRSCPPGEDARAVARIRSPRQSFCSSACLPTWSTRTSLTGTPSPMNISPLSLDNREEPCHGRPARLSAPKASRGRAAASCQPRALASFDAATDA